jgi:CheY-like chemotaxis protein
MPGGGDVFLDVRMFDTVADSEELKLPDHMPEGKYVKICIADEGLGMDKATTERIFDPFFSTKTDTKGVGLGLASAYGIVKNHRGHILVASEPGRGSVFEIYLPASARKAVARSSKQRHLLLDGPANVLVVDDEDGVRKAVRRMLEALGSSVTAVESGIDAIELLSKEKSRFDLVVLDMIMPEMSGAKAFAKIREIDPSVKVLIASAYNDRKDLGPVLARDGGTVDFIRKPFQFKEFSRKVIELACKSQPLASSGPRGV